MYREVDGIMGMGRRVEPESLFETLSPWADPVWAAESLEGYRVAVNNLAFSQKTALPDSVKVLSLLHLRRGVDLAALAASWPAMGVVRVGGQWTLNVQQFDVWAQGQVSILKRKAERRQPGHAQAQTRMTLI